MEIALEKGAFVIRENAVVKYTSKPEETLHFDSAYVVLLMSTHSNYPARELYFENVEFHSEGE